MSQWGGPPRSPTTETLPSPTTNKPPPAGTASPARKPADIDTATPQASALKLDTYAQASPNSPSTPSRARGDSRLGPRPNSMLQTYQPPQVEVAPDTPPELQPIFSFLNSHSNKLYQEGYFLKLHDLDSRGRPSPDRAWTECFAQLVGTVLSLWDAAALDVAGEDGEVVPTFINLSDASIKMVHIQFFWSRFVCIITDFRSQIESLPMTGAEGGSLQNVLSISTAANNRYLLHFNSLSSLTQWTAGIRLAMFEHSTLQEAYTGSLIAGKGRFLNNIKPIMERSKFAHEDWARVRFGAGTPWKRCWCVISPPDEKEYKSAQKTLKKTSAYERVKVPKGDIKFYDTRKITKKTRPIATVTDAYAAYAIYPQSKPLIDQSTLVKLEGLVTVHGSQDATSEGFVFVMPEVHPAVTGFEMMLRWLFPVYDTFGLYGRPTRLIADTLDQRGLMFALPRERRYGYLDTLDVSGLIHTQGSQAWSERQWRREMKKLTSERMMTQAERPADNIRQFGQRRNTIGRESMQPGKGSLRFEDKESIHSSPGSLTASPVPFGSLESLAPRRTDSAPPGAHMSPHKRSVSDAQGYKKYVTESPSRLSYSESGPMDDGPPAPPKHGGALGAALGRSHGPGSLERITSGDEVPTMGSFHNTPPQAASLGLPLPESVVSPPAFTHNPNSRPANQPYAAPELRRTHSNVDAATLYQMQDAIRTNDMPEEEWSGDVQLRPQQNLVASNTLANRSLGAPADRSQGLNHAAANFQQQYPRQRLSTIEGSPYVGEPTETFQPTEQAYRIPPQLDGAAEQLPDTQDQSRLSYYGAPESTLRSSRSILRKPVPVQPDESDPRTASNLDIQQALQTEQDPMSPDSPVAEESWEGALIDSAALERILDNSSDRNSERNNTIHSSHSHASSMTPDYASTIESAHSPKKSIEKKRAGRLKTVGDPEYQSPDQDGGVGKFGVGGRHAADVPTVDFGPTFIYKPSSRPGTSGTVTSDPSHPQSQSGSDDRRVESSVTGSRSPMPRISPGGEGNRHSYFGGRPTPSSAGMTPTEGGADASRTPGSRHSVAWQPASSPAGAQQQEKPSLTPEQWVQYRAAMAAQPQHIPLRKSVPAFAHQRQSSANSIQQLRKSVAKTPPPLSRTPSGDWTQQGQQQTPPSRPQSRGAGTYFNQQSRMSMAKTPPPLSRTPSGDWTQQARQQTPPSRPHSRGAGTYLNPPSPGRTLSNAQPTSLTAKEQMHIARATGAPLVSYTSKADQKQQEQQQPGLFGALAAREREKEEIKKAKGRNSTQNPAVQQAIAARQHQLEAEAQAQAQAHYQMQMQQAAQQAQQATQLQQMQQMQYQQMMQAQSPAFVNYPTYPLPSPQQQQQQQQQRPTVQTRDSWLPRQQQQPPQYGGYGGAVSSPGTPNAGFASPFALQQGGQSPLPQQQPSNRASFYGAQQGAQQYQQQQRRA